MPAYRPFAATAACIATSLLSSACGSSSAARGPEFNEDPSPMADMMVYMDQAQWLLANVDMGAEARKAMDSLGENPAPLTDGSLGDTLDGQRFDATEATLPPATRTKSGETLSSVVVRYLAESGNIERRLFLRDGQLFQCHISREQTAADFFSDERPDRDIAFFVKDLDKDRWLVLKNEGNIASVASQRRLFDECLEVAARAKRLTR